MTLVALWVRKNMNLSELVAISDSRVSAGELWDLCPKLIPLPRPATAIAMSGDATTAYAFLLQAMNTCLLLDGNEAGRTDIRYLARKLRDIYSESRSEIKDAPSWQSNADIELNVILFGWSWRRLRFEAFSYKYNIHGNLVMQPVSELEEDKAYGVYFAGDATQAAKEALSKLLHDKGLQYPKKSDPAAATVAREANLDWEPLEILQNVINDSDIRTVGGVPQLLRIYQYGMTESFVWRDESGDYFGGRPVRHGERFDRRIVQFEDGKLQVKYSDKSMAYGGSEATDSDDDTSFASVE